MNEYVVDENDAEKVMGNEGLLVKIKPDKPENNERIGEEDSIFRFIC